MYVVGVVCCQVEVSLPCVVYLSIIVKPGPTRAVEPPKKKNQIAEGRRKH